MKDSSSQKLWEPSVLNLRNAARTVRPTTDQAVGSSLESARVRERIGAIVVPTGRPE